jgi:ribosome-associated toxin RatA of RatAB toxin-antitoxin module
VSSVSRSALVPHTPERMFELVNDVRGYPRFLPWVESSEVLEELPDEMLARLNLQFAGMRKAFTTRNRLQPGKMIEIRLVDGPFHHLEGFWRFTPLGEGQACKVQLDMEFEFATPLVSFAFGPVFMQMANSLVDAFSRRADELYGRG